MTDQDPDTGGEPESMVVCAVCGETYPAQAEEGDGGFRPIGTDGSCECGSTEFETVDAV